MIQALVAANDGARKYCRMEIVEIIGPEARSAACAAIISKLPDWFAIPAANERYIAGMASKDVFAASVNDRPIGLLALRYHFGTTAEIWWMGIVPEYHRQGIGRRLIDAAKDRAIQLGCTTMVVTTLSPRCSDKNYAGTRAFYEGQGFRLLVEFNEHDPRNPMAWMVLSLATQPRST